MLHFLDLSNPDPEEMIAKHLQSMLSPREKEDKTELRSMER